MIYNSAQNSEPENNYIKIKTIEWVRKYLADIEFDVRMYAKSAAVHADEVSAFIAAVDLRANDYLILNDDETYSKGILAIYKAGLLNEDKCRKMLEIGNHNAYSLMGIPEVA